jgi:hypothetical protein
MSFGRIPFSQMLLPLNAIWPNAFGPNGSLLNAFSLKAFCRNAFWQNIFHANAFRQIHFSQMSFGQMLFEDPNDTIHFRRTTLTRLRVESRSWPRGSRMASSSPVRATTRCQPLKTLFLAHVPSK